MEDYAWGSAATTTGTDAGQATAHAGEIQSHPVVAAGTSPQGHGGGAIGMPPHAGIGSVAVGRCLTPGFGRCRWDRHLPQVGNHEADQKVDGNTRPSRHVHRSAADAPPTPRGRRGGDQRRHNERQCRQSSVQANLAATESKEESRWKRRRRRHRWVRPWYAWIFVFSLVPLLLHGGSHPCHFDAVIVGSVRSRDIQQRYHSGERMHLEHRAVGSF
mmetsp:Transcript_12892/g.36781  ORF Transcript_12892/g.36781 Transcript_12892/m.36781 type:complete len:216 (-) Transcript_12892:138-785(-)